MLYIGIDLGGTNIAAGIVGENGQILRKASVPTNIESGAEAIVNAMADLSLRLIEEHGAKQGDFAAIGIGLPGIANPDTGLVYFCTNLFWHNVPVRDIMQRKINLPVIIENDATVAGLAEHASGVFKGKDNCLFITLGTGVGGGMILNGKVFSGAHHVGSEIGHIILVADGEPCTCGNRGCFERYASATALINMAKEALKDNPYSLILKKAGGIDGVDARCVIDSAREKDAAAMAVYERYIRYLALGIASLINTFDPEIIALGGGVSNAGEFLLDALRREVPKHLLYKNMPFADIVIAKHGSDAGIIGAAMLGVYSISK